jgi:hypothetical protein
MKNGFLFFVLFYCSLVWSADETEMISLAIGITKTEFHHLEPVTINLKITNNSKEDFVLNASMVCVRDTKINLGDSCALKMGWYLGGVVITPGKTQELLMPERVFSPGEHKVSVNLGLVPGLKSIKSNQIAIKVRKATKEEALVWTDGCLDIYEKLVTAQKSRNNDTFSSMYYLLLFRIRHEDVFCIPIMAKILDDGIIGFNDREWEDFIYSMGGKIYHNKEFIEKNIDIKYVISTILKSLKTKKNIRELDSVIKELMPWMSNNDKKSYKEFLKSFIRDNNDENTTYLASDSLLAYFPEEYKVVETAVLSPTIINPRYKKELKERIESAKKRVTNKR